jgi:hypothetical protein
MTWTRAPSALAAFVQAVSTRIYIARGIPPDISHKLYCAQMRLECPYALAVAVYGQVSQRMSDRLRP